MQDKVFVSPGVYTSEKELQFVTTNVGVTTLGLVGEVTQGPAFKPIFVSNYDEFRTFFGGLNTTKIKDSGFLRYELPYAAKSYLSNSNQLYVTRVLGLSGYNAGNAYIVTLNGSAVAVLRARGHYETDANGVESFVSHVANGAAVSVAGTIDDMTLTIGSDAAIQISLNKTKKKYITRVLGRTPHDGQAKLFVEEIYENAIQANTQTETAAYQQWELDKAAYDQYVIDKAEYDALMADGDTTNDPASAPTVVTDPGAAPAQYGTATLGITESVALDNFRRQYKNAETPFVVSEVKGGTVSRLFKFHTISDGEAANTKVKMSIINIKPDEREFDVIVRDFNDTDADPVLLERYTQLNMDPSSKNYIGRRIGTVNGDFISRSKYILMEMAEGEDVSDSFPAGYEGYAARTGAIPEVIYKAEYGQYENKRKFYLGTSANFDSDILKFKGLDVNGDEFTEKTLGFHMDSDAAAIGGFVTPTKVLYFKSEADTYQHLNKDYEKLYARKFTIAPAGGHDGWDIYRTSRTNTVEYTFPRLNTAGLAYDPIENPTGNKLYRQFQLTDKDPGVTSDYYAYLEAIRTFANAEAVDINVFATPGLDTRQHPELIDYTIEMIERERSDSLYIISVPDTKADGSVMTAQDAADSLYGAFDSNYTAAYWPWIQQADNENNALVYLPPTGEVLRNIALTDNTSYPWFAVAGFARGDVKANKARLKLTQAERDTLYEARLNPLATFSGEGIKIFGNKNLQLKNTPLDRINVRRLLLQTRKLISAVAVRLLFDQNDEAVRSEFLRQVNPILESIRKERGLTDFRVKLEDNPEQFEKNSLTGKIFIKPTSALEYIELEFNVMPTGASFEDL